MITVFIGTYNRLETLDRTIKSYKKFKTPHELVIVDNGTDNPQSIALLERLEKKVKKIYSLPACVSMEEATDNFNIAIRDQYETDGGDWFAVSEADVCFEGTHPKALDMYVLLASKTKYSVGPHLRADKSIPAHYPLRSRVLACETWMQYRKDLKEGFGMFYNECQIDTTFHLFPRMRVFNRLKMDPMRVGPPYDAMHLDWYINVFKPNKENKILIPDKRPVGSWGKAWIRSYWTWHQESPEKALEKLLAEPLLLSDLCNNSFMLSWCYQYGVGCEQDLEMSRAWLQRAIPLFFDRYWKLEEDWLAMIYENDFSSLGWES